MHAEEKMNREEKTAGNLRTSMPGFEEALTALAEHAGSADGETTWPAESWELVKASGALRWGIPAEYGGEGWTSSRLLEGYEQLAQACLTSCFILSQRDAACRRILGSSNRFACQELLPALARGERFTTVGLSHLTTSRQHLQPALTAQLHSDKIVLNGVMPWVTGASQADHIVTGATCDDGRQILLVLPRQLAGVEISPPLELMALAGSITAEIHCADVQLDRRWLLAGPKERVMAQGKGGTGGLETSCLALGLAGAALEYLREESASRPELPPSVDRFDHELQALRNEMHALAGGVSSADSSSNGPDPAIVLRGKANTLVLRATQTALTAAKGAGFLKNHPAQRWARQAMFFLVWSCPRPAAEATLAYLVSGE
jgi:alkylation response protein AidB-like acyl-CoA dehydrogenase